MSLNLLGIYILIIALHLLTQLHLMLYILVDMSMSYMYEYTLYNFCKIKKTLK